MTLPTLATALLLAMTGAAGAQSCIGVVNGTVQSNLPCPNPPQWMPAPDLAEWCKIHDSYRDNGTRKHISICNGFEWAGEAAPLHPLRVRTLAADAQCAREETEVARVDVPGARFLTCAKLSGDGQ